MSGAYRKGYVVDIHKKGRRYTLTARIVPDNLPPNPFMNHAKVAVTRRTAEWKAKRWADKLNGVSDQRQYVDTIQ